MVKIVCFIWCDFHHNKKKIFFKKIKTPITISLSAFQDIFLYSPNWMRGIMLRVFTCWLDFCLCPYWTLGGTGTSSCALLIPPHLAHRWCSLDTHSAANHSTLSYQQHLPEMQVDPEALPFTSHPLCPPLAWRVKSWPLRASGSPGVWPSLHHSSFLCHRHP